MDIAEKIYRLRTENGLTQAEFGRIAGASDKAVSTWELGKKEPRMKSLQNICAHFHIDINQFADTTSDIYNETTPPTRQDVHAPIRIPVLGSVPAGIPIEAIEDIIGWEELPSSMAHSGKEYFALRVSGDSMYPKYLDGDIVIVRHSPTCDSGDDCIVYVNGYDATLKTVILGEDDSLTIRPINTNYAPRTFTKHEVAELPVSIAGVVAELRRKIKG